MQAYLHDNPDAQVALDQLAHARPWFATFQTVPVRRALGDQAQGVLAGRVKPAAAGQRQAEAPLEPFAGQTELKLP